MQLFEDLIKCKDCMNNINNKCILYPGKDTKEENTGCYVGGVLSAKQHRNDREYVKYRKKKQKRK